MRLLLMVMLAIPMVSYASDWAYDSKVDAFTDIEVHTARSAASDVDGFIVARCTDGSFELYFSVGEFIGSDDLYPVRHRIDKETPGSSKWGVSTKGTSIFASTVEGQRLARSMMSGSKLLIEVTDYQGTPHRASYSLNGSKIALQKVLEACAIPLVEYRADTNGITAAVVEHLDMLGPRSIECKKRELAVLGYRIDEISPKKSRQLYEHLDDYYQRKLGECPESGFSIEPHCISEGLAFLQLYSDASDIDDSIRTTCGSLTRDQ